MMKNGVFMKAVVVENFDLPDTFNLQDITLTAIKPKQVLLDVKTAGVSLIDVLVAQGKYQVKPPLPYIPGTEFAGVVSAVGSDVTELQVGDRVLSGSMGGGYAEQTIVDAQSAIKIPAAMPFNEAAVFRVSYLTAYHALVQRASLRGGEVVLVLGAAGAIGSAAIQIAKALDAKVIASASSQGKREYAKTQGADWVVDSNAEDWREQIKTLTGGQGIDVVVDPVGGAFTEKAFRSLGWNGRHLVIGFAAGDIPKLPINLALLKGASLIGVDVRQLGIFEPHLVEESMAALFALYETGKIAPVVDQVVPLSEFRKALNHRISGDALGAIVLTLSE